MDDTDETQASTPTDAEIACFEAGIKFGSLYHQFAGTPLSSESAGTLARAMEASIENQPHCQAVRVDIREDELEAALERTSATYTELTGRFLEVEIDVKYEGVSLRSQMELVDEYPLMSIVSIDRP